MMDRQLRLMWTMLLLVALLSGCKEERVERVGVLSQKVEQVPSIITGAENIAEYLPVLQGKRVAMVVNQTSLIGNTHLVDTLLRYQAQIEKIFAPEHGFRGEADAGESIADSRDAKTGIPVISLYGKKKKPSAQDLAGVDIVVFDIQDVGARFYTYISSLHYVMEACAELDIPVVVLDRPNPNAHYIDGPVLERKYQSFVGMHPVPVVYGMTIGEYGLMINGEGWLADGIQADLTVVKNRNYAHGDYYNLPVRPSPNLPNIQSILLYPSLCFFEGTTVSVGRGTDKQFQIVGHPNYSNGNYTYTPQSSAGSKYPKHEGKICKGIDLTQLQKEDLHKAGRLDLSYLLTMYEALAGQGEPFFLDNNFFEKLAGTDQLRQQIIAGNSEEQIRNSWKADLDTFKLTREKYLLYDE